MIIKFKPSDFEECLMGLAIENWKFVDEIEYNIDKENREILRPMMMISHLDELSGVTIDDQVSIKAFTTFDDLMKLDQLGSFKTCITRAVERSSSDHQTIGCHIIEDKHDPFIYPFFVAMEAKLNFKSYMQERTVNFSSYTSLEPANSMNRNEILYEILFDNIDYDYNDMDIIEYMDEEKKTCSSYYLGATIENKIVKDLKFAVMLPSKRVIKCEEFEKFIIGQSIMFDESIKKEVKKIYYHQIESNRLNVINSTYMEAVFELLIWAPLMKLKERTYYDET